MSDKVTPLQTLQKQIEGWEAKGITTERLAVIVSIIKSYADYERSFAEDCFNVGGNHAYDTVMHNTEGRQIESPDFTTFINQYSKQLNP